MRGLVCIVYMGVQMYFFFTSEAFFFYSYVVGEKKMTSHRLSIHLILLKKNLKSIKKSVVRLS